MVVIDTNVWSLDLRRRRKDLSPAEISLVFRLHTEIQTGMAIMLGVVRQELLSGVSEPDFMRLRERARVFDDPKIDIEDIERAAACHNAAERRGIAISSADAMICGYALNRGLPILTLDRDFLHFKSAVPIKLHPLSHSV